MSHNISTAMDIVRSLARLSPYGNDNTCFFCLQSRADGHPDDCLWARATRWTTRRGDR